MLEIIYNKKTSSEKAGDNVQSSQSTKQLTTAKESFSQVDFKLIEPNTKNRVLARNLYKFLELDQSNISRWLKLSIAKNKFAIENEDFWGFVIYDEGNQIQDFEITPNFAKKLAMMSKSKNGEKVRDYFLEMERIASQVKSEISLPKSYLEALEQLIQTEKFRIEAEAEKEKLALQNQRLIHSSKTYKATEIAKELNLKSANQLNKILEDNKMQYKVNSNWVLTSKYADKGYTDIKQFELENGKIIYDRVFTGLGRDWLLEKLPSILSKELVLN